jgi:hypothetical protein
VNTDYENDFIYLLSILKKTPDKELVYISLKKTIMSEEIMSERNKMSKLIALSNAYKTVNSADTKKF